MPFIYVSDRANTNQGSQSMKVLLADSTTFTIGDAVKENALTGTAVLWGAGGAGLGIIHAFVKADGSPVTDNGAGGSFTNTYTTPASNTVYALVDVSKTAIFSVVTDATVGTTTGSNKAGVNFDCIADSDKIDEDTVQAAGTTASFVSYGLDPNPKAPANSILVSIQESQLDI